MSTYLDRVKSLVRFHITAAKTIPALYVVSLGVQYVLSAAMLYIFLGGVCPILSLIVMVVLNLVIAMFHEFKGDVI